MPLALRPGRPLAQGAFPPRAQPIRRHQPRMVRAATRPDQFRDLRSRRLDHALQL